MTEKSTEQVLRDALQNMVGHFKDETVLGRITSFVILPEIDYGDADRIAYYPVPDTFRHDIKAARAALALPDSGDHDFTDTFRGNENKITGSIGLIEDEPNPPPPDSGDYAGLPPTDERIEELARELCAAIAELWSGVPWGALCDTEREKNRIIIHRLLAKHPEMVSNAAIFSSSSCPQGRDALCDADRLMLEEAERRFQIRWCKGDRPLGHAFEDIQPESAQVSPTCAAKVMQDLDIIRTSLLDCLPSAGERGTPITQAYVFDVVDKINVVQDALRRVRDADPKPPQPDLLAQVGRLLDEEIVTAAAKVERLDSGATLGPAWGNVAETVAMNAGMLQRAIHVYTALVDIRKKIAALGQDTKEEKPCETHDI